MLNLPFSQNAGDGWSLQPIGPGLSDDSPHLPEFMFYFSQTLSL